MSSSDRQRACDLMVEALALCDRLGEDIAAARLQLALDTLQSRGWEHSLREDRIPWSPSE